MMIAKEMLPKGNLEKSLENRLAELNKAIRLLERRTSKSPGASLRVESRGKNFRYFAVRKVGDTHGTFIRHEDWELAEKLAQFDYDCRMLDLLRAQAARMETFLDGLVENPDEFIQNKMHEGRRRLVTRLTMSDDEFVSQWMAKAPTAKILKGKEACYETSSGFLVRSKSEIIIAESLVKKGIPFWYENSLDLKGGIVCPDFTCLDVLRRKEVVWEHFGRMDDPVYATEAVAKLKRYRKNGYVPGDNFIATFETLGCPLDVGTVMREIAANFQV